MIFEGLESVLITRGGSTKNRQQQIISTFRYHLWFLVIEL